MGDTPLFNIDLLAFDTFILAVRTTDGKILMKLESDGILYIEKDIRIPANGLGYYDREKNEIKLPESDDLPEKNE